MVCSHIIRPCQYSSSSLLYPVLFSFCILSTLTVFIVGQPHAHVDSDIARKWKRARGYRQSIFHTQYMFLHIENRTILWNSLQKSPYIVEFLQKYPAHRETWFRGIIEQFYTQWISQPQNQSIPQTANELLEMNKAALKIMVSDLKRLLGYHLSAPSGPGSSPSASGPGSSPSGPAYQEYGAGKTVPLISYDVASEKKKREDKWSSEFSQYQTEYNRMLSGPVLPRNVLPTENIDERIKNADELLAEYAKRRELDLPAFSPPVTAPAANDFASSSSQPSEIKTQNAIQFSFEPSASAATYPRLKILDEIRPPNTKSVSWSEELESVTSSSSAYECSI